MKPEAPTLTSRRGIASHGQPPLSQEAILRITQLARVESGDRVLLAATGSDELACAFARLADRVLVVERDPAHARSLEREVAAFGATNVLVGADRRLRIWDAEAPFNAVVITGPGMRHLERFRSQVAVGGRLLTCEGGPRRSGRVTVYVRVNEQTYETERTQSVRLFVNLAETVERLGLLAQAELEEILRECQGDEDLAGLLVERGGVDERDVYFARAIQHGIAYEPVTDLAAGIDLEIARALPRAYLEHQGVLPLKKEQGRLVVAVSDPGQDVSEIAQAFEPFPVDVRLTTPTDLRRLWMTVGLLEAHRSSTDASKGEEPGAQEGEKPGDGSATVEVQDLGEAPAGALDTAASLLFDSILLDAISSRASDIHLEHGRTEAVVRLRIDGSLHPYRARRLSNRELLRLVNVFKVRASMDIAERRLPQGGGMRVRVGKCIYDLRVQTQPSLLGENAVVRILPQAPSLQSVEDLGFPVAVTKRFRRLLASPSGLVLVVGPTGSGKSTTLYSGLRLLAADGTKKILTAEDPIEYSITGVQQSQINPAIGFDFAQAVRAFLRQDPDVILVGEIRDGETAREALRASQTGHLVLATLHCNESTDAARRLVDLGVHPAAIAGELVAVLSQRLARCVCPACGETVVPDARILEEVYPDGVPADFTCRDGRGCLRCRESGTHGRRAVVEFLEMTSTLRALVAAGATNQELRRSALQEGLVTLRDRALSLVAEGTIPLRELPRILPVERMSSETCEA